MASERIQKILARSSFGSRRACEELITANRVTVNGRLATLGQQADAAHDQIAVDGKLIPKADPPVYIALNKPRGVLSDVDSDDPRPSVLDLIPLKIHLYPVGRLDLESEGLILLTNDGELANRLTHPRYGHEKEYRVQVVHRPDEKQLAIWRRGVVLEDGAKTAPARVIVESGGADGAWLTVIMHEGRKRQIREVGKRIGLPVSRIIRLRIGTLHLGDLRPGEWRYLSAHEVNALQAGVHGVVQPRKGSHPRPDVRSRKPISTAKKHR